MILALNEALFEGIEPLEEEALAMAVGVEVKHMLDEAEGLEAALCKRDSVPLVH